MFSEQSLVRRPLRERRELLHGAFHEREGEFLFARCMVSSSTDDIADFLEQSIRGNTSPFVRRIV